MQQYAYRFATKAGILCPMEEQYNTLEVKLAFLEDTVNQLNEVVISQQAELAHMATTITKLAKKVTDLMEMEKQSEIENRRPPHY